MKKIYLFATIAAIIAGFATFWFANDIKESLTFVDVAKVNVVVAKVDISADTIITGDMLAIKSLPQESVSKDLVSKKSDLIGKMAMYPIHKNEQINQKDVVKLGSVGTSTTQNNDQNRMSYQLKKGEYAFTFEVNVTTSDGFFVKTGDFVNLIVTNAKSANTTIKRQYEKIKVLRVGSNSEIEAAKASKSELTTYSTVTLLVNKKQSLELVKAVNNGSIRMELISYADAVEDSHSTK